MISSASNQATFEVFLRHFKQSCKGNLEFVGVFMVDKAEAERNAIHAVFPDVITRLCYWHAIEALRRWLVMAVNCVNEKDEQQLVKDVFKKMVFAATEEDFKNWFTKLEIFLNERDLSHVCLSPSFPPFHPCFSIFH